MIFADYDVATAKQTQVFTEREVHVKGNRPAGASGVGFVEGSFKVLGTERVKPFGSGRIAGIARPGDIVLFQKLRRDVQSLRLQVDPHTRKFTTRPPAGG